MPSADRRTIYEKSCCDRRAYSLPATDVPEVPMGELVPAGLRRAAPARLPEVGELELLRHFTYLSTLNFGVESGSYPLGSCTMKYNPKINEVVSRLEGFAGLHPYQPESLVQGAPELMYELEQWLAEIAGHTRPAAAPREAHGMDPRAAVLGDVAARVAALPDDAPRLVGLEGVDGAGKTVFADELALILGGQGFRVVRVSIDGFHRPRVERHRRGRWKPSIDTRTTRNPCPPRMSASSSANTVLPAPSTPSIPTRRGASSGRAATRAATSARTAARGCIP